MTLKLPRLLSLVFGLSALAALSHAATPDVTQNLPCSPFKWAAAEGISDKAAILVPISMNGKFVKYDHCSGRA